MVTNRQILVDNSTLSGVERITGLSQTMNLNYIDNDILCLEKLVTAILFSDRLLAIDDYKSEYRSKRFKNFDFIEFSELEEKSYSAYTSDAAAFAREMAFSFEGSKPAGDVVSFFDALRIDPQLRWDIFVSSEYLTLSFLLKDVKDNHYPKAIDSIFRNEDTDRRQVATVEDTHPKIRCLRAFNDFRREELYSKPFVIEQITGRPRWKGHP